MGGANAAIGFLPTYEVIGWAAPIGLLLVRVLQGLALGGEYGGAAVYVAEHVPDNKRGFYTSFIQITATLGLFMSLIVILVFVPLRHGDRDPKVPSASQDSGQPHKTDVSVDTVHTPFGRTNRAQTAPASVRRSPSRKISYRSREVMLCRRLGP